MNWYKTCQIENEQNIGAEIENVYKIPDYRMEWLEGRIKKLNKTCKKLELPPITISVIGESIKKYKDDTVTVIFKHIKISGEAPVLKGWKFIGRIMHTNEGNILKIVPGETVPDSYRKFEPKCDHCGYNRRRNDTFIVRNIETGEFKQCGSNCLKDFIGHSSPNSYAKLAEDMADLNIELRSMDDDFERSGGISSGISIEYFVLMAYLYVKSNGFISRSRARETGDVTSTADRVWNLLISKNSQLEEERREMLSSATEEDKDFVKDAIAWARGLKEADENKQNEISDYLYNLSVSTSLPVVKHETCGLVASLPSAYMREISNVPADFQGLIGKRGENIVEKVTLKEETPYDNVSQYVAITSDGHEVKWFGNIDFNEGDTINIRGIVKGFSNSFGKITTILTKVDVIDESQYDNLKALVKKEELPKIDMPQYNAGDKFGDKKEGVPPLEVTILGKNLKDSAYGLMTIYNMTDKWGNNLVWFGSGEKELNIGDKVYLQGTVKGKQTFRGKEQIVLTRCKPVEYNEDDYVGGKKPKKSVEISDDIRSQIKSKEEIDNLNKEVYKLNEEGTALSVKIEQGLSSIYDFLKTIRNISIIDFSRIDRKMMFPSPFSKYVDAILSGDSFFTILKENIDQNYINHFDNIKIGLIKSAEDIYALDKRYTEIEGRIKEIYNIIENSEKLKKKYKVKTSSFYNLFKLC